nr:hypothetical protein [Tanacetum cinerariifolium]
MVGIMIQAHTEDDQRLELIPELLSHETNTTSTAKRVNFAYKYLVPAKSNSYYQSINVKSQFGKIDCPKKSQVNLKDTKLRDLRVPVPNPELLRYTYCWRCIRARRGSTSICTYTDDLIIAMVRGGKQCRYILGVGRVLAGRGKDVLDVPVPQCNHTFDLQSQHESGSGSRSGAGEDDESSDDKDIDEDEEDTDRTCRQRKQAYVPRDSGLTEIIIAVGGLARKSVTATLLAGFVKRGAELTIVKRSRDEVSDASIAAKCSLPQKRPCVRKPFPLNGDIIDGCMQHGTINLNRVSGDSQLDQPAYIDHEGYPTLSRKMCCHRTRYEQLPMGSNLLISFTVKRSRDGVSSTSTATKCSLAQKRPCEIQTGLPMSGGLEFGKCYNLPTLSGPRIDGIEFKW